jgi:hypothetical protein
VHDLNTAGVEVEDLRLCPQLHVLADSATVGLLMRSVKAVQAGFVWLFPLTFASNAFVQTDGMLGGLQAFIKRPLRKRCALEVSKEGGTRCSSRPVRVSVRPYSFQTHKPPRLCISDTLGQEPKAEVAPV